MNARLQPIGISPLVSPTYDNVFLGFESDWLDANREALQAWFQACEHALGTPLEQSDFIYFARSQHDIELTRREDFRNYLREF